MTATKTCLMVMHAREIPECMLAIRALRIDKVWFRGFTEPQLEAKITEFVRGSTYDRYILVSDDVIPTQQALDNLLSKQDAGPVVTGWCNIMPGETMANVELRPIVPRDFYLGLRDRLPRSIVPLIKRLYRHQPFKGAINAVLYGHFPDLDEVWAQAPVFRTYFVGWALTSITRECWLRYGFHYSETGKAGHGSDQKMSLDLAKDGVVMLCARDSFVYHLGSTRRFIVGKVAPEVLFEPQVEEYDRDYIHTP